jgi:hypothetical protein
VAAEQQRMAVILALLRRVEEAKLAEPVVALIADCADCVLRRCTRKKGDRGQASARQIFRGRTRAYIYIRVCAAGARAPGAC